MAAQIGSIFVSTVLLSFAVTLAVAGAFGAYYGKGRSRSIGFLVFLIAVLLLGLFASLTWDLLPGFPPVFVPGVVAQSMVAVVAALFGALLAVLAFVATVMRS
jgi:uncharacterized membrane protein YoaK (UPF0700 family)